MRQCNFLASSSTVPDIRLCLALQCTGCSLHLDLSSHMTCVYLILILYFYTAQRCTIPDASVCVSCDTTQWFDIEQKKIAARCKPKEGREDGTNFGTSARVPECVSATSWHTALVPHLPGLEHTGCSLNPQLSLHMYYNSSELAQRHKISDGNNCTKILDVNVCTSCDKWCMFYIKRNFNKTGLLDIIIYFILHYLFKFKC